MSSALVVLRGRHQVTLPTAVRRDLHIDVGDFVEFVKVDDGVWQLRGKKTVDAGQAWFWTAEWQAGEREASAELSAGSGEVFTSVDDMFAELDRRSAE